jgi:ribose transport system substrate-binding protein
MAMVLKTLNNPFFVDMQRGAEEAAKRLGVDLTVQAAERETDVEKQMQIIENLVETGVNALAVAPSGSKEVVTAVAKANAASIPVVIVDDKVDAQAAKDAGVHWEAYVGSDNVEGGRIAGRYLVQITNGTTNVALLEGIPGHQTGDARLKGFKEAIQASPGVKIVASQTANWERDQGFNVFQNMMQAHPDIDAVFACNDMMALGAVEAIRAAGKTGKIRVIGFDAIDDARKAIAAGTMDGSVAQFPSEMGRIAVENAVKLIHHEPVQAETGTKLEMITNANVK